MKLSIRYKFIFIVLAVAVPFFVYTVFHYFHTVDESKTAAIEHNRLKAIDIASELGSLIATSQNSLYSLALHPSVVKKDSKSCNELFSRLLPLYPLHLNILAIDMNGKIFGSAASVQKVNFLHRSDMEWFSKGIKGISNVTDLQRSRLFEKPAFMVTMPVFSEIGEQIALLGFPVNLHELQHDFIDSEGFDTNTSLTVIDNNSNVLISTRDEGQIGHKVQQQKILLQIQAAVAGSFQSEDSKNEQYYYSFSTVDTTGWKVLIGVPVADVYKEANRAALRHVLIFFLLGGATAIFAFIYSSVLSGKVELLIEGFNRISEGKLDYRLTMPGSDEFSTAAAAFNDMADARQKAETHALTLTTTLEKRVEQRTAELLGAKNELEAFSYAVSHDLQAPVRHILAYAKILIDEHTADLPEPARQHLARISRSGESMRELIIHLLTLSRVGMQQITAVPIDLSSMAEEILRELIEAEQDRVVEVRIEEGLQASGDRPLLGIAMKNLIENAWKYSRNTAAPLIEVGRADKDGVEAFFVRDNGCGFEMSYAGRLFVPFQRLHTAEQFEGTGVGLATVHRIINRHGGRIWAESQPGMGAVFYFTLQLSRELSEGDS